MDHFREQHILFHVQKLFPRQKKSDALEIFLILKVKHHSKRYSKICWLDLGATISHQYKLRLRPVGINKYYKGKELCKQLIEFYNNEYWLVVLWDLLCNDAKQSSISREITRAFIKHCISVTADQLILYGPQTVKPDNINNDVMPNIIDFYKKVLSYDGIISELRNRTRKKITKFKLYCPVEYSNVNINPEKLIILFDRYYEYQYSQLVETVIKTKTPQDRRNSINLIILAFSLVHRFLPGKLKICKALKKLIEE